LTLRRSLAIAALLALSGCAQPDRPIACVAPLKPAVQLDLHFGRDRKGGSEVSDAEWAAFLAEIVTPRFPAGLAVVESAGQWRSSSGTVVRERSKLVTIVVFDAPAHRRAADEIVATYLRRFGQDAVLRVEKPVCAAV
jgi:hypothetical protein